MGPDAISPPPPWTLMNEAMPAVLDCDNCFQLTSEGPSQTGCIWDDETVDLSGPIDITVKMYFGDDDGGADGICLILASSPDCGVGGGDIGAGGIPNSIIFEFDTWDNGPGFGDIPADHVSMDINGVMTTPLFGPSSLGNIEDDMKHLVRFVWDGAGGFQIFFDGSLVLSGNYDFSSVIGGDEAFLGFTASTGGAWNNQFVCPDDDPIGPPDPAEFIESTLSVCAYETGVIYAVDPVSGVTYEWTAPPGAVVNGSGSSVTIDWGDTGGEVCVVLDNGCGTSDPVCIDVEVTPAPQVSVADPGVTCDMEYDLNDLMLFNVQPGEIVTFHPSEAAAEAGFPDLGNPPVIQSGGTYWIRIEAGDECFQVLPVQIDLEWLDLFVIQPDPQCEPGSLDLSTVDVLDLNGFNLVTFEYYLSPGDAQNQTNPLPGSVVTLSGSYWVRAETANGCFGIAEIQVEFYPGPDLIAGNPPILCAGDTFDLTNLSIQELNGLPANAYTLSYHASALAAVNGSPAINPPVVSQSGTYWIRATTLEGCYDTVSVDLTFLPAPTVILSGGDTLCTGDQAILSFQVTGTPPFTVLYTDGVDTFVVSGSASPIIMFQDVTEDVVFSILSYTDGTPPGCPQSISGTAAFHLVPPLSFTGLDEVCDQDVYQVTFDVFGGDSTSWTVLGGAGTWNGNSFTSDPIPSGMSYAYTLTDASGCDTVLISGIQNCDCATDAGHLVETAGEACVGDTIILTFSGDGFLEPDDIRQYALHQGPGGLLSGIIAWQNQPVFVFIPGLMTPGVTYYVSPVAGNGVSGVIDTQDVCLSVTPGTPIVFHALPEWLIPETDTVCASGYYDLTCSFTGTPPFEVTYQIDGGIDQVATFGASPGLLQLTALNTTEVTFTLLRDANCSSVIEDTFHLIVREVPEVVNLVHICDASNATYTIQFDLQGGDSASYVVSGLSGTLVGHQFISDPIPSGSPYSLSITDGYGCDPVNVSDSYDCLCMTTAGQITGGPFFLCLDDTLAFGLSGTTLDANDSLVYWLVSDPSLPFQTLLWTSDQPVLSYPGLPFMPGVSYYLLAMAGNAGSWFGLDTLDSCLDGSDPVEVMFVAPPDIQGIVASPGVVFSCQDSIIQLSVQVTGSMPFTYAWSSTGGQILTSDNLPAIDAGSPGWYTVEVSESLAGCRDSVGILLVASNDVPKVVIQEPVPLTCAQTEVNLDATGSSFPPGAVLEWVTVNGEILQGGSTLTPLVSAAGLYQLWITDPVTGCIGKGSIQVKVDTLPPVANAGPDILVSCDQLIPALDGSQSTGQGPLQFNWSTLDGSIIGPANLTMVQPGQGGIFVLQVVDLANGCIDSDDVVLTFTAGLEIEGVEVLPPACFGESSGSVFIGSIAGGSGSYTAQLGPNALSPPGEWSGLAAGTYFLQVQDDQGCQWDTLLVLEEAPVLGLDLGADLLIEFGDEVVLTPSISGFGAGGLSYSWFVSDSLVCVGCLSLTIPSVQSDLTVTLEVMDQSGCQDEDMVQIRTRLLRKVYIPSSFSPNFDGINDVFAVYGNDQVRIIRHMAVFDRWGNALFDLSDILADGQSGWSGLYRSRLMDPGVYVYYVDVEFVDGSRRLYKGDLHLIR
ncbi:MAG: gliding motility-associated C-terminal domain-containing protein [Saprospiraceae bacterium]